MTFTEGPRRERHQTVVGGRGAVAPVGTIGGGMRPRSQVRRPYASRLAPDAALTALVGLVLLLVGLIAVIRAGLSGTLSYPVVDVAGFHHTAALGLIEVTLGVCLLATGASLNRSAAVFFGGVLGILGFVGGVQASSFHTSLALDSSMAWLAMIAGIVVVAAALLMPRYDRTSTSVDAL